MSLHADTAHDRLIFEPYQPPVIQVGLWPEKRPTLIEILRKHFPMVCKLLGNSIMIAYFLAVGYQFIIGPTPEKPKYDPRDDYAAAVAWVKS